MSAAPGFDVTALMIGTLLWSRGRPSGLSTESRSWWRLVDGHQRVDEGCWAEGRSYRVEMRLISGQKEWCREVQPRIIGWRVSVRTWQREVVRIG
jgi:hypothetical protein